jgi:dipeptidyl aminopeptidase/acylaminoacyl peptidase
MTWKAPYRSLLAAAALSCAALSAPARAEDDKTLVPGDNLVVEGLPKIPLSLVEGVGRYTESRAAAFLSWNPKKREMLISTRFADTNQVHRLKMPGGARTQLTFFPDRVAGARFPRNRDDYFVFVKDAGGNEFGQLYRYDLANGAVTLLSDGGRSQNGLGRFSHKGDRMAYASTRRNGADRDIYVIDPMDPKSDRLVLQVEGGGWGVRDWSPDDGKLLVEQGISVNEGYLWLVDVASGEKKLLTPKGSEPVAYEGAVFDHDGKGLFVTTDKDSEFLRLAHVDLASGKHTFLTASLSFDVDDFDLSPDGKTLALVTNEDGASALYLLNTATGALKPGPKLAAGVGGGVEWDASGREVAFSFGETRSPTDVFTFDAATLKVERWTESEAGGLNPSAFSAAELVRFKSFDGKTVSGFLLKPPARFTGPRPVIVNIHGGPEGQARPSYLGRNNYLIQELGVAMIYPNVRGSTGFGKTFTKLDNGILREDSVKDIGALLDWIATRPDLDKDRVMITGGSYGGYMTLAVATHYDARIRCSLDVVGISNFITFLERTESYRRDLRRVEYGDERDPKIREFFERVAPVNNASKITKPLFVVQGRNDPRVPHTEALQMVETVKKNGGPVWFLMANDEGHGFVKKKNADFLFYSTVAFVQAHLLN